MDTSKLQQDLTAGTAKQDEAKVALIDKNTKQLDVILGRCDNLLNDGRLVALDTIKETIKKLKEDASEFKKIIDRLDPEQIKKKSDELEEKFKPFANDTTFEAIMAAATDMNNLEAALVTAQQAASEARSKSRELEKTWESLNAASSTSSSTSTTTTTTTTTSTTGNESNPVNEIKEEAERILKELDNLTSPQEQTNTNPENHAQTQTAVAKKLIDESRFKERPARGSYSDQMTYDIANLSYERVQTKQAQVLAQIESDKTIAQVRHLLVLDTPLVESNEFLGKANERTRALKAQADAATAKLDEAKKALKAAEIKLEQIEVNQPFNLLGSTSTPTPEIAALEEVIKKAQTNVEAAEQAEAAAKLRETEAETTITNLTNRINELATALGLSNSERGAKRDASDNAGGVAADAARESARAQRAEDANTIDLAEQRERTALKTVFESYEQLTKTIRAQAENAKQNLSANNARAITATSPETLNKAIIDEQKQIDVTLETCSTITNYIAKKTDTTTLSDLKTLAAQVNAKLTIAQLQAQALANATYNAQVAIAVAEHSIEMLPPAHRPPPPPPPPPPKPKLQEGTGADAELVELGKAIQSLVQSDEAKSALELIDKLARVIKKAETDGSKPPLRLSNGEDAQAIIDELRERVARCCAAEAPQIRKNIENLTKKALATIQVKFEVTLKPLAGDYTLRTPKAISAQESWLNNEQDSQKYLSQVRSNIPKDRSYEPLLIAYRQKLKAKPHDNNDILNNCMLMREQLELYQVSLQQNGNEINKAKYEAKTIKTLDMVNTIIDQINQHRRTPTNAINNSLFHNIETIPLKDAQARLQKAYSAPESKGGLQAEVNTTMFVKEGECTYADITILHRTPGRGKTEKGTVETSRDVIFHTVMSKETGRLNMDFHLRPELLSNWKSLKPWSNEGRENFAKVAKATVDLFHQHPDMQPPMAIKSGTPEQLVKAIICYCETQHIRYKNNSGVQYIPTNKDIRKFKETLSNIESTMNKGLTTAQTPITTSGLRLPWKKIDLKMGADELKEQEDKVIGKDRPTRYRK